MKLKLLKYGEYVPPLRAHYNDAGADVYSPIDVVLEPHSTTKIPLGFGLVVPDGFMGVIFPRSSYAAKGIVAEHPPIDSGYRGEIHAIVTNMTSNKFEIKKHDRVGQLVVLPVIIPEFVENLGDERGQDGFGSSGK